MAQDILLFLALFFGLATVYVGIITIRKIEISKAEIDKDFKLERAKLYAKRDIQVAKVEAGAEYSLESLDAGNNNSPTGEFNITSIMELLSNPQIKPLIDQFMKKKE